MSRKKSRILINKDSIPNCERCGWTKHNLILDSGALNRCGAQGFELTYKVYNNRMCKKLYEKKE